MKKKNNRKDDIKKNNNNEQEKDIIKNKKDIRNVRENPTAALGFHNSLHW